MVPNLHRPLPRPKPTSNHRCKLRRELPKPKSDLLSVNSGPHVGCQCGEVPSEQRTVCVEHLLRALITAVGSCPEPTRWKSSRAIVRSSTTTGCIGTPGGLSPWHRMPGHYVGEGEPVIGCQLGIHRLTLFGPFAGKIMRSRAVGTVVRAGDEISAITGVGNPTRELFVAYRQSDAPGSPSCCAYARRGVTASDSVANPRREKWCRENVSIVIAIGFTPFGPEQSIDRHALRQLAERSMPVSS